MTFDAEPPGTVLTVFDDGSAIVKGDGSPEEKASLLELLEENGVDDETRSGIAQVLLDQGLTLARIADPARAADARTMGGQTFAAIADQLGFGKN